MKLAVMLVCACLYTQAQTYTTLYSFQGGTDGSQPQGPLTLDAQGNIYGAAGDTIFELSQGVKTILYSSVGFGSNGGLIFDTMGNLYGTTSGGGTYGYGTVFKLSPAGILTTLFSFNAISGWAPEPSPVILDTAGNLYGTTLAGGHYNRGTVYELVLQPSGTYIHKIIYTMYRLAMEPGCLMLDSTGAIYGTARGGGNDLAYPYGSIFKLIPNGTGWTKVVHSFKYQFAQPVAGVIMQAGNLYGVSQGIAPGNYGAVFMGSSTLKSRFYALHAFTQAEGSPDTLVMDTNGNFYGATWGYNGGANGLIFKLNPYTVLYSFDSANPAGTGLTVDSTGNLYGVTEGDGVTSYGSVFELQP